MSFKKRKGLDFIATGRPGVYSVKPFPNASREDTGIFPPAPPWEKEPGKVSNVHEVWNEPWFMPEVPKHPATPRHMAIPRACMGERVGDVIPVTIPFPRQELLPNQDSYQNMVVYMPADSFRDISPDDVPADIAEQFCCVVTQEMSFRTNQIYKDRFNMDCPVEISASDVDDALKITVDNMLMSSERISPFVRDMSPVQLMDLARSWRDDSFDALRYDGLTGRSIMQQHMERAWRGYYQHTGKDVPESQIAVYPSDDMPFGKTAVLAADGRDTGERLPGDVPASQNVFDYRGASGSVRRDTSDLDAAICNLDDPNAAGVGLEL